MRAHYGKPFLAFGALILLAGLLPVGIGLYLVAESPGLAMATGIGGTVRFVDSPLYKQWIAVLAGFLVKPTYMLLSLALIILLWRKKALDLLALRWGLVFFLAGEVFCAINYLFFEETSALLEYLHSYGMALGVAFMFLALIEALDRRILRYTDPDEKCAALSLCSGCIKYKDVPCGLQRAFNFLLPALASLAILPLTAGPLPVSYNTTIFGTFYNYSHAMIHQIYEIRFCPLASIAFLAGSWLFLSIGKDRGLGAAKLFLALAIGHLGFGFLRMILLDSFQTDMVWFVFWEEATELLLILGIAFVLWTFRRVLLVDTRLKL